MIQCKRHAPVRGDAGIDKLHFISVRDPLDQYISLYSYGCAGKGIVFPRLALKGYRDLYERSALGFERWLEFVLDPTNAALVDARYTCAAGDQICRIAGLQTFRFLFLALRSPGRVLGSCRSSAHVVDVFRTKALASVVIRHSHFVGDLQNLVRTRLRTTTSNPERALQFLQHAPPWNTSDRIDKDAEFVISLAMRNRVREREWFFYNGLVET